MSTPKQLPVMLPRDLREQLEKQAAVNDRSLAAQVRVLLRKALSQEAEPELQAR